MGLYALLWQQSLKTVSLTSAYANKGVVIVWGLIWGIFFFQEVLKWNMVIGGIIIILGIYLVVSENE